MSKKKTRTRQDELDIIVDNEVMLTTTDNPFNPFIQFEDWNAYDIKQGYNSCSYVARIAKSSQELSESDEALAINQAINEIVEINLTGNYIKVTPDTFKRHMKTIKNINLLKE